MPLGATSVPAAWMALRCAVADDDARRDGARSTGGAIRARADHAVTDGLRQPAASLAERMTARAARRSRFVALAVAMTSDARRAIAARRGLVQRVASRARRVVRDAMEARQRLLHVAALAGRWPGVAVRAVRAMAGRAGERAAVRALGLCRMAGRTCRRGLLRSVGLVTGRAGLVASRRRGSLVAVATRARGGRCIRRVVGGAVTARARGVAGALARRGAIGVAGRAPRRIRTRFRAVGRVAQGACAVTGARRGARPLGVAARAGRGGGARPALVRDVAVEARRGRVRRRRMTGRARNGLRRHRDHRRAGVRRVAAGASPGRSGGMADLLGMTAGARARPVIVRRVAGRALVVCPGREHRAILVTRRARLRLRGGEVVGCVTAGARGMSRGARRRADPDPRRLRCVAARAAAVGGEAGLVHAMTVEAAAHAGVLGLAVGVALGAGFRIEGRRPVRAMTARARLIGVRPDRVRGALWLGVTLQALGGRAMVLSERVAVLTARCGSRGMERRRHRGMALRTQLGRRRREPSIAVAFRARELAHVRRMTRALAHVVVRGGDLLGYAVAARAAGGDRDEDEPPSHRALPIGWQSRHGSAPSGNLLDQPAGCGVPPTPPTLWQPTHSA